ncbi:alpha/beta hydrolase [Hoeflea poritis]|uniref:Alpha/beta fold hydrolase n=1 Tax=Hoeflea poritis TaxID=2993659 RepID=A0ABT4VIZ7_9HYPH|nr:alpha/beta fold hydrolase [Hoeflea poritis]MDA4844683.1 alpha/beta fold hydrolase [Hoeflea poritis]
MVAANTQIADIERVFVATMRAPTNRNEMRFSSERADRLHFADIDVSVPKQRKVGKLIGPTDVPDPSREFGAVRVDSFDDETAFVEAINREMLKRPPKERVAFVFVHGYNTKFGESVYRHAQLRKDYNVRAVPVTYSWPSAGKLQGYLYDRDSAQYARDGLIRTLKLLQRSKARSTFIVAHSMGTLLTMETLRQASISGDKQLLRSVGALVLAAPDIDNDVFKEQVGKIDPLPDPFVMFVSSKDQALRASQLVRRGTPRVGEGEEIATWQSLGITVVDLSNVPDGGLTKHGVYASSPTLIRIIQDEGLNLAMLGQDRSDYPQAQAADSGARFAENVVHFPTNE